MIQQVYSMFEKYGFLCCPLSGHMIRYCIRLGFTVDQIYSVGCDVFGGWSFREAVEAARKGGEE